LPLTNESAPGFEALNAAALRIHQDSGTLHGLLDVVATEATSLLRADHAVVWLRDPDWGDLSGHRSSGEDEFRFPLGAGLTGRAAKTRKTFRTTDAPDEAGYDAEIDSPPSGDASALMIVPLLLLNNSGDEELVGVLAAFGERVFDDEDERMAALLAGHAAAALAGRATRTRERRLLLDLTAALTDAVDRRTPLTLDHSYRVREYCKRLGRAANLDIDSQLALELAALLHSIGRGEMAAGGESGAELDEAAGERILKTHVVFAEAILRGVRFPGGLAGVPEAVLSCLRSAAGTGGTGGKPSAIARMLLIADAYDVYLRGRDGRAGEAGALDHLKQGAGKAFDAEYVDLFIDKRCHLIEQRRFARMDLETPIDVTVLGPDGSEGNCFQAEAVDLSEGGVLLRSDEQVEPGTAVRLTIHLPSGDMAAIARVTRILTDEGEGRRIGVYFLWYGPAKQ
jgi:HD-GYP domain-containing protein (c-di-GMP phosphodiesterase class II)